MIVTVFWGATFVIVKQSLEYSGPFYFVAMRFLFAGLVTACLFRKHLSKIGKTELIGGACIGLAVYLGYGLQTVGLQEILVSQSAFLTALYVPIVPVLQWLLMKKAPRVMNIVGIGLSFLGMILITGQGGWFSIDLSWGELLTFFAACAIAFEIVLLGIFSPKVNVPALTVVQLLVVSVLSFITAQVQGEPTPIASYYLIGAIIFMGLGSGAVQLAMGWAQRSISPTRATLIYTCEPIWGGVAGAMVGETMGLPAIIGAGFILSGVLVSELKFSKR